MMKFDILHQEHYSRGELLLRSILGFFYILIPHGFLLGFLGIAAGVLHFLTFWVVLFTGRYPESWFEFQVKYQRWNLRVSARILNMADGYPAFGLDAEDDKTTLEISYPTEISRGLVLVRAFFGFVYVLIPHGLILGVLGIGVLFVNFIAFWAVLFTAKFPRSMFNFQLSYLRWSQRVSNYLMYLTDQYPPFHGEPDSEDAGENILDADVH